MKSLTILLTTFALAFGFIGCATQAKKKAEASCCGSSECTTDKSCPSDHAKGKGKKGS